MLPDPCEGTQPSFLTLEVPLFFIACNHALHCACTHAALLRPAAVQLGSEETMQLNAPC